MNKLAYVISIVLLISILSGCGLNSTDNNLGNEVSPVFEQNEDQVVENEVLERIDELDGDTGEIIKEGINENNLNEEIDENVVDEPVDEATEVISDAVTELDYEALGVNEVGHIMVVMYHGIIDNPPYHRTAEDFVKDLQYMYDNGYRLISMGDYVNNNIEVEAGYTPIVLTFDDGLSSTFSLEEINGELSVVETTAIGLLEQFSAEHPDFGKAATLYINGYKASTFMGDGTYEERLNWLIDNGYDVGNHTVTHSNLSTLTGDEVQYEIGTVDEMIKEAIEGYTVDTISYPLGMRPSEENRIYVPSGEYDGHEYAYTIGFREGPSGPYYAPIDIRFDPYNCPRVRGSEGDEGDLWWYFDYYETHANYRYYSDGNSETVVVPQEKEEKVDMSKMSDKALIVY
jgi:peptidoglycan/xylan/chitin deacetylase (PgdA/CDA1 family)